MLDLYQTAVPSVVSIQVTQRVEAPLDAPFGCPFSPFTPSPETEQRPQEFYQHGVGSRFVWDRAGHIVTNYHLVAKATTIEVRFANGQQVKAEVLGTDPDSDRAVLKVDLSADELHPLPLADSDTLQPGQLTITIGNPFRQEFTMTSGIVSAVGRTILNGYSLCSIPAAIQTDAPINPGNSGGPLLNRYGEVSGINAQILSHTGVNAGLGFAIPINAVKLIVPTLIKGETFEHTWLGITSATLTPEMADLMKLPAGTREILVIEVAQDGPADEAGLQGSHRVPEVEGSEYLPDGDVIIAINDQPVVAMDDLIIYLIEETRPGDEVTLEVIHANGEPARIIVTVGVRPRPEAVSQEDR